ncbi:hypothetical protein TOPH_02800 [Tolypocladium ophioglossoides CBS 100239]|uniref:Uncharacterized protein n=1 Tax=Tolypocladium ophioglossoides (strain CBS 100239) TaxID=1163406 RepID=A0A0L0NFG2_TOLOC|nr:hypothetical protein TOPH_02800 [Tolypocladium ophioglossoides CBS 100239]
MGDRKTEPQDSGILAGKAAEAASGGGPHGSASASNPPTDPAPAYEESAPTTGLVPTVSDPFNFPSNDELPPYEAPASSSSAAAAENQRPIAIPQVVPDPASAFISAYPPVLLSHGVTEGTWRSFLEAMSGFLTAKVSDRAVSHAGDIAKQLGEGPKSFGKGVVSHAKHVGKDIADNAKRGNIVGAAFGVIGGLISIPVATGLGAAGAALQLPGSAVGAIAKKPQTPFERATAYAMVANKKWLHARGLQAQLVDTGGLAKFMSIPDNTLLGLARGAKRDDADGQLKALEVHIAALRVRQDATLVLAPNSLWLVLVPVDSQTSYSQMS